MDEIVAKYVRSLNKESSLYSFVIDNPATILDLFADPGDKTALENVLVKREGERPKLTNAQEDDTLKFRPAEVHSHASSLRKNKR